MFRRVSALVPILLLVVGVSAMAVPSHVCERNPDHPQCQPVTTTASTTTSTVAETTTTEVTTTTLSSTTTVTVAPATTTSTTTTTQPPVAGLYGAGVSGAAVPVPSGAISVTPSTLVQEINNRPAGTAFALQPGTYVLGNVPNKAGNRYYGVPSDHGAVVFDGQTTYSGSTVTGGHQVAFRLADNNVFANMTFRRYRGLDDAPGNSPLFANGASDVVIRNVEFRDNQLSGLRFGGSRWQVSYITSQRNGQYCMGGSGSNHVIELSLFAACGVEGLDVPRHGDSNRGISKFNHSTNITVRTSEFRNITGGSNGLWFDGNNAGFTIVGNYLHDMQRHGIIVELGEGGTIRNNVLVNVAYGSPAQEYRDAAIFSHFGGAILIEGNTIDGARNGIMLYQHDRTFDPAHGDSVCGSVVRNNTVKGTIGNAHTGMHVTSTYEGCNPMSNPGQVVWENNTEVGNVRHWLNGSATPTQWAARGYS